MSWVAEGPHTGCIYASLVDKGLIKLNNFTSNINI